MRYVRVRVGTTAVRVNLSAPPQLLTLSLERGGGLAGDAAPNHFLWGGRR